MLKSLKLTKNVIDSFEQRKSHVKRCRNGGEHFKECNVREALNHKTLYR